MYFNTRQLLRYKPLAALLIVINQSEQLRLNPDQIRVVHIEGIDGTETLVRLEAKQGSNAALDDIYLNNGLFKYNRLDIADVFDEGHVVNIKLPTTTHDLLDVLERDTGILFDKSDLFLEPIWNEEYLLKPRDTSLRWVGEVTLNLIPSIECIQLSSVLTANVLQDLKYPEAARRLRDHLLINILDDLNYPTTRKLKDALVNNLLDDLQYPGGERKLLADSFNNNILQDLNYPTILKPEPVSGRKRILLKDAFLGSII